jgi:hypothetical protein
MTDKSPSSVEERLCVIEDKLAIYELIAWSRGGRAVSSAAICRADGEFHPEPLTEPGVRGLPRRARFLTKPPARSIRPRHSFGFRQARP